MRLRMQPAKIARTGMKRNKAFEVVEFVEDLMLDRPAKIWQTNSVGLFVTAKDLYLLYSLRVPNRLCKEDFITVLLLAFPSLTYSEYAGFRVFQSSPIDFRNAVVKRRVLDVSKNTPQHFEFIKGPLLYANPKWWR